jgi:hypothetical protein
MLARAPAESVVCKLHTKKIPRAAQYPRVHSELEGEPGAELCVPLPRKAYVAEVPDWLKGREKFKLLD